VVGTGAGEEPRVFRRGGISYLRIPATEPRRSAECYEGVFGWKVDADRDDPSFEDGTGHVIGQFMADLRVGGGAGVVPYRPLVPRFLCRWMRKPRKSKPSSM
jgi:hypothetical protein